MGLLNSLKNQIVEINLHLRFYSCYLDSFSLSCKNKKEQPCCVPFLYILIKPEETFAYFWSRGNRPCLL